MVLTLSDRIKLVRMSQPGGKLSRAEFGARLGMSASMIQNMEDETRRKNEAPDVVLRHICDVYNVSYLWLTTGEGQMLEPESPEMMVERLMVGESALAISVMKAFAALPLEEWRRLRDMIDQVKGEGQQ